MLDQLGDVQLALRAEGLEGWLLSSAGGQNGLAERLLEIDGSVCQRRWFYYVPADGVPVLVAHRAELLRFPELPGERWPFTSWAELRECLSKMLPRRGAVAMEYSPLGVDPQLARVDAGTVELVRTYGPFVSSSDAIVRRLGARWNKGELDAHEASAAALAGLLDEVFRDVGESARAGRLKNEAAIVARIEELATASDVSLMGVQLASGPNTADPTHRPRPGGDRLVEMGDLLQVTLTGSGKRRGAAELGDVAVLGADVPPKVRGVRASLIAATEAAHQVLTRRLAAGRRVLGFEIDRVVRDVLEREHHAAAVLHRSGHGLTVAGAVAPGTQLDNLEMHDTRPVEPGYVFSLHPGLYGDEWGMRLTTCFHIDDGGALHATSELAEELRLLGAP